MIKKIIQTLKKTGKLKPSLEKVDIYWVAAWVRENGEPWHRLNTPSLYRALTFFPRVYWGAISRLPE
jgi:hypothetical protein